MSPSSKLPWAATHARHAYLAAQYRRLAARRGGKRALVAVAPTILIIAYRIIRDGTTYEDLGSNYFDEREPSAAPSSASSDSATRSPFRRLPNTTERTDFRGNCNVKTFPPSFRPKGLIRGAPRPGVTAVITLLICWNSSKSSA